jgi:hypothetical protein
MLRVPKLEALLLRLVDPHAVHKGREPTESEDVLNKPGTNENGIYMYTKNPFPLKEDRGLGKEENIECNSHVDNPEQLAAYLATKLSDEKSIAWYRMVARRVDHNIIRDALMRALDIPARDLRRSRGAVFTAIVRPHLRDPKHNSSKPLDHV